MRHRGNEPIIIVFFPVVCFLVASVAVNTTLMFHEPFSEDNLDHSPKYRDRFVGLIEQSQSCSCYEMVSPPILTDGKAKINLGYTMPGGLTM